MSIQRRIRRLSATALAVVLGLVLLLGPLARPASAATAAPALDATFSTLLNTLRTTLGIGTLTVDRGLSDIARSWSVQMANSGTLSHNGALTSQVTGWAVLGENVGTGGAATQVFNALVASPSHMRNMSNGQFTRIGIGTVTDGHGHLWTTHVFMRPKAAGAAPAPAPKAAPVAKASVPAATRAPDPAPTTSAPVTAPPTTAAPVTEPPTPAAPVTMPMAVAAAANAAPTEATVPATDPVMEPASSTPGPDHGASPAVLAGAGLVALLALAGGGLLLRRSGTRPGAPALPTSYAVPAPATQPPRRNRGSSEDLTKVLDLL